jgi:hypothetical protein
VTPQAGKTRTATPVSDSPQKTYRRSRTRWIAGSVIVTLCTGVLALLKENGRVAPAVFNLALAVMIVCWTVTALVWCTHAVMGEQRRRETRTVDRVEQLLTKHNVAGWAAYAEEAENVHTINRRRR